MKDIVVLLTRVGSFVSVSYINTLKTVTERKIRIVGVDSNDQNAGSKIVDIFYKIGEFNKNPSKYCEEILEIVEKEKVNVILPTDEEESVILRRNEEKFKEKGVVLSCPTLEVLEKFNSKSAFYEGLKNKGLPYPHFFVVEDFLSLEFAARKLGYPQKEIIIKPIKGVAERGFRILSEKVDRLDFLYNKKPAENLYLSLEDLKRIIREKKIPKTIVSEFLGGKREYSVDTLSKEGKLIISIPKFRIKTVLGASSIGEVSLDKDILELTKKIIEKLNLNSNINIQFKENDEGLLVPYEANLRIAGTISLTTASGANLIYFGIKQALGEEIPIVEIKNKSKIYRYLGDYFPKIDNRGGLN